MTNLSAYLPQDRLHALARNETLPDRTIGSALFADISGFTPLTEKLRKELGPRRGAEELSKQLEAVYTALITEVEKYGGSVIGFAGDAMTCWFEATVDLGGSIADVKGQSTHHDPQSVHRNQKSAIACALALQATMTTFTPLALKVAIASGPARRLVVGDPTWQVFDVLAGATLMRMADGEHVAQQGEVLVDESTAKALGGAVTITEWREAANGEHFAVVTWLTAPVPTPAADTLPIPTMEQLQSWVPMWAATRSAFINEFRAVTFLFLRFTGIDYEADTAPAHLDAYVRWVQSVVQPAEGYVRAPVIGDKGNFFLIAFGAPTAHEDDARRAVRVALTLRTPPPGCAFITTSQMGIATGITWAGLCGGPTRHAYDFVGDDANLAARLMQAAAPGEILVSATVHKIAAAQFQFEPHPPVRLKGKTELQTVFSLRGEQRPPTLHLQEPHYALPMVGREKELVMITEQLTVAIQGQARVIGIVGEAGVGKSRLVAEVIRRVREQGFVGYGGACQSDGMNTPYLAWKAIWSAFFAVEATLPVAEQIRTVEDTVRAYAPTRLAAVPLLRAVLNLAIPDNDFTQGLEPQYRQSALHALLEDCLRAAARNEPILIVLEDLHWLDALSHTLLETLGRALQNSAVGFILAYRPPLAVGVAPKFEVLPSFSKIVLAELTTAEATQALQAKLGQLFPLAQGAPPPPVVETLLARAQGNPFYLEELLNYLHDRRLDPYDPAVLAHLELPNNLHALILSRIDQLTEPEKIVLRVACIIGRLFLVGWLLGYYPELSDMPQVLTDLEQLARLDITPLDTPEPELAYLFKHIVTHEVTYESLSFATRAKLHERLAGYLENMVETQEVVAQHLDTIAFHYTHSGNVAKKIEYLRKAGEAAQKNFANDAALNYYGSLLPLLKDEQEKAPIYLKCGQVHEFLGHWDHAESNYRAALEAAQDDLESKANAQFLLGRLNRLRGDYANALEWLGQANEAHLILKDTAGLAQGLIETGRVLYRKNEYAQAREALNDGLARARAVGDRLGAALALKNLGLVAWNQGDYTRARAFHEESLNLWREMDDKWGIAASLGDLGNTLVDQGDNTAARVLLEESLALRREIGDKWGIAAALNDLAGMPGSQGDYAATRVLFEESLSLFREMGDKKGIAALLNNLGLLALTQGDYSTARALFEEVLVMCKEMGEKYVKAFALLSLGLVDLATRQPTARVHIVDSLRLRQETGEQNLQISSLVGMAGLVLQEGYPHLTAQLLGAGASALTMLKAALELDLKPFHAQTLAAAKDALGEGAFQAAWEEGAQWTLEEAVQRVLQEDQ